MHRLALALLALALLAGPARADEVTPPTYAATATRAADGRVVVAVDAPAAATLLCPVVQAPAAAPPCGPANPITLTAAPGAGIQVYLYNAGLTYLGSATATAPPWPTLALPLIAR